MIVIVSVLLRFVVTTKHAVAEHKLGGCLAPKANCGAYYGYIQSLRKSVFSASEMTYIMSGGALNSTHSLT